mgnify:CR=1 FL=1
MTLIDVVTVIGSIAAVVAAVLAYLQTQMPFLKNVIYTKEKLSFTFATSLLGCEVLSIRLEGAKLRDSDYFAQSEELAEDVVTPGFITSPCDMELRVSFACFHAGEASDSPVLHVVWRKWFITRSIDLTLSCKS